jgi:hypothetical protein
VSTCLPPASADVSGSSNTLTAPRVGATHHYNTVSASASACTTRGGGERCVSMVPP